MILENCEICRKGVDDTKPYKITTTGFAHNDCLLIMKMYEELAQEEKRAACEATAKLMQSPTWPHVLKFAERMEAKLEKNRHKGDREGWLKDNPWSLVERILDETVEVQQCFSIDGAVTVWLLKTPEETADECADVANFCMMLADRVTHKP